MVIFLGNFLYKLEPVLHIFLFGSSLLGTEVAWAWWTPKCHFLSAGLGSPCLPFRFHVLMIPSLLSDLCSGSYAVITFVSAL